MEGTGTEFHASTKRPIYNMLKLDDEEGFRKRKPVWDFFTLSKMKHFTFLKKKELSRQEVCGSFGSNGNLDDDLWFVFCPSFFKIVWLWLNWSKFRCWHEILFVIFMNFIYVFLVIILVSWFVGFQICVDQAGTTLLRILWKWNCNEIEYSRLNKLVRYPWKLPKRIENWWTVGREHPVSVKRLLLKDFANCILRVNPKNVIFKKSPRGLHCGSLIRFILQVLLIFQSMRACCWQFGYE